MPELLLNSIPVALLLTTAAWGILIQTRCRFKRPDPPRWPFATNPGLALELAGSLEDVDAILGPAGQSSGDHNRCTAKRFQKLDFVLIPLYTAFFITIALRLGTWAQALPAVVLALATAVFDYLEDARILRMVNGEPKAARPFGKAKWFCYFSTVAVEGALMLPLGERPSGRMAVGIALAAVLLLAGLAGMVSSVRGSFTGILSQTTLSMFGLLPLSLVPLISHAPVSWHDVVVHADLVRVPLLLALILVALPVLAFFTGAKSLLRGLFDLTPGGMFAVTLAAFAAARTAIVTAALVVAHAPERFGAAPVPDRIGDIGRLVAAALLAGPLVVAAILFSIHQKRGKLSLIAAALGGYLGAVSAAYYLDLNGAALADGLLLGARSHALAAWAAGTGFFHGYVTQVGGQWAVYPDHLRAAAAMLAVLALYAALGYYGFRRLGKARTVPALTSGLMLMIMVTWLLAGAAFFFDQWRVPLLFVIALAGTLTAQSARSDHFYTLRRRADPDPAPDPARTITASGADRVIVVAANGGGIQAGAWAAQVFQGLNAQFGGPFVRALRMISSVSGGSMGTAFFVHSLADPAASRPPADAAADSSLDEVAWGLGWTDFLRALVPWVFGRLIGRGRALERAWLRNGAPSQSAASHLDKPLSSWNAKVAAGTLPGVVLNATLAETGERLLLATTRLGGAAVQGRARVDAADLHCINGEPRDVGIVTAARLSASFPYVTPAARSDGPGPQPHVVDGGYYDNYGMATLVEWLDEALTAAKEVKSVLVIQVLGAPLDADPAEKRHATQRGWFYQAFAPLTTLAAVRSAGQLAHNDIELELIQQKWLANGVPVHTVKFEFHNPDAPLSWHLTPEEIQSIRDAWKDDMGPCRRLVGAFLDGRDDLNCGCPRCNGVGVAARSQG